MKSRLIASLLSVILACLSLQAEEHMKVEGSTSPDGEYYLQVTSAHEDRTVSVLELVAAKSGHRAEGPLHIGYGYYPSTAAPDVLHILWAPDSKTVAIMLRGTKTTLTLKLCRITEKGLQPITLSSSITETALKELGVTDRDRFIEEKPLKWLDSDRVVVRARGHTRLAGEYVQYVVDVTCSVSQKSVLSTQRVAVGPAEN